MTATAVRPPALAAPAPWMVALEYRAFGERALHTAMLPLLRRLPKGDGHHVIVLPGFTAGDRSTRPLRHLLRDLGYHSHGWRLGLNVGPTPVILDGLGALFDRVTRAADAPVSIIGWSLGGIYARELARAAPDRTRQVITLGSPIQMVEHDRSSAQRLWAALRHLHAPDFRGGEREAHRPHLSVPATSIYSRTDGVVDPRASIVRVTPISENVRVIGSHCGLGFNTAVAVTIADRLSQPAGEWAPFRAPRALRGMYPRVDGFDPTTLPPAT